MWGLDAGKALLIFVHWALAWDVLDFLACLDSMV
jgi:hypothetical protein